MTDADNKLIFKWSTFHPSFLGRWVAIMAKYREMGGEEGRCVAKKGVGAQREIGG
jgi:hypothetical protein